MVCRVKAYFNHVTAAEILNLHKECEGGSKVTYCNFGLSECNRINMEPANSSR